ncbi:MAG: CidA/LrgA family protein [Clostridia bacterium]|nr:CidA/LrgA family protein [Clostridia bacterium]
MRFIGQFCVILLITFIGELLNFIIPLPVPAGIYGMALLFIALCLRIIRLDMVEGAGDFLIEIMPVMFIPAGVGLMSSWGALKPMLLPAVIAVTVVTVVVMAAAGRGAQGIMRLEERRLKK